MIGVIDGCFDSTDQSILTLVQFFVGSQPSGNVSSSSFFLLDCNWRL